jgi:hypothetical protein
MIHPHTELRFISHAIGFGVVATAPIPRGTITWVRDPLDRAMTADEVDALGPLFREQIDKFTFIDRTGRRVLCWDIARYVNHACDAACLAPGFDFEIAVRDIAAGEQVCDDYATLNLLEPFECACGAAQCRKIIVPDDHLRLADAWDDRIRAAFASVEAVSQPLWPLVSWRDEIAAALSDPARLPSCRVHFLADPSATPAPAPLPALTLATSRRVGERAGGQAASLPRPTARARNHRANPRFRG